MSAAGRRIGYCREQAVHWTWLPTGARSCRPAWLAAGRQPKGKRKEREREREHLARLQHKKRMRHKQNMFSGYSRGGSVAAGHICSVLDLAPTPPLSLPPPSTHSPCHQLVCSLIYLLPVSQMRLMIRTRTPRPRPSTQSHSQLESPFPYHAPMRRFAHLSWSHSGAAATDRLIYG